MWLVVLNQTAGVSGAEGRPSIRDKVLSQLEKSPVQYSTLNTWSARRKELREEFLRGAGLWPLPEKKTLHVVVHSRRQYDGYSVENVALETMPGFFCTGNLYRPLKQDRPRPGILCPHGHFQPLGRMRPEQQIRCAQFARMGATVFSYSMVGWQDSRQTTHDDPLVLALQTWNSIRALDYLCSLSEVDTNRLGITGASGGGTQTFFLAALDDRVRVSAPVVIVYPWTEPDGCRCEGGMPVMQTAQTDAIELAASVAPRPQLLISCGNDPTSDFPQVGFPFIQRVYALHGKSNLVENVHLADEGHDYGPSKRRAVYAFFAKHLGLPSIEEELSKITIEQPEQMAVFDDQHPLPAHAIKGSEQVAKVFHALARAPGTLEGESFFFTPPGFAHEGQVARAEGKWSGLVKIVTRDAATGRPTPSRISVVGPDGNYYQPSTNHLTPYALTSQWPKRGTWGNRRDTSPYRYLGRFFYTTGEVEVALPAGKSRIEVWKGFEFTPQTQTVEVSAGGTNNVELAISKAADVSHLGYFGGDLHLHIPRRNPQDENTIFDLMSAEDIQFGALLAYNEPAGPYAGFMDKMDSPQSAGLGVKSVRERDGYSIIAGQEYRSSTYGHLLLYLRDGLVFPGKSFNADNWPVYGEVERETRELGGLAIMAHGGYAQEIYADVALGNLHAVELLQFDLYRGIGLTNWYDILNTGYRFPITGASDWPACRFLGDSRTFVHVEGKPSHENWLRRAAEGRSFVTSGPMLLLEIEGQRPGTQLKKSGSGPQTISVRVRTRSEVTPVQYVELIVNGEVVYRQTIPADKQRGAWWELEHKVELRESSWIAARAYSTTPGGRPDAEAHTNPVYVYLDGHAPYRQASLDAWLAKIDGQIAAHAKRNFAEKARVLDYFQQARDTLLRIRERGGLRADENPAQWLQKADALKIPLAAAASFRAPTDEELEAFLQPVPPKTPQAALKTFETTGGFHMELVAAEPMVYDPVAAAFDADGNLYVCEMRDYPFKPVAGREPIGSVRLLRDTNGDGVFDQSTVFADKLLWAAGVAPWKGGVFVAAPPDIWYFKDTNGDDVADIRLKVFTGFGMENQQAMLNNLVWWLDHKIYGSTAGNGGTVRPANNPQEKTIDVNGNDFRFDPVGGEFEAITGTVQFGNTFDDWGNRFLCSQSQPLVHVVLPRHYLARNPYLPVPSGIKDLAANPVPIFRISPVEHWRQIRSHRRVEKNELSAAGAGVSHHVVDAAAGVTIYRGGAYPPQYYGTVFTPDPQNNLIHHRRLIPDGVSFKSQRVEEQAEFVRSSDIWFRPVNLINAPDGTLYCLDMSREVLESIHIPLDVAKHLDLTSGRNYGRIYRIAPNGFHSPAPPRLSQAKGEQLVVALESPHGWWRDTAHRLIYERQDKSIVPALKRMAAKSQRPESRLAALWSLEGLNSLQGTVVLDALNDRHPGVRENAVRLAEPRLNSSPQMLAKVLDLASDTNARVRFQVAFTLGEVRDRRAVKTLVELAGLSPDDPWMRAAVLSSMSTAPAETLSLLLSDAAPTNNAARAVLCDPLAEMVGQRNRLDELRIALQTITTADKLNDGAGWGERLLPAIGRGLKRAGARLTANNGYGPEVTQLLEKSRLSSRQAALDGHLAEACRLIAIQLLGCFPLDKVRDALVPLLDASQPTPVQIAAVKALADYSDSGVADLLLQHWRQFTPDVRAEALQALLSREGRTLALLHAAEQGQVSLAETDAARREPLLRHRNEEVRRLARKVFGDATRSDRVAVVAEYRAALQLDADPKRGGLVFEKNCSVCHALNGKGNAVGPDLASASSQGPEALLVNILDPSRYVLPNFVQYTVEDKQGRVFSGLIASQTATSITLKGAKGATDTILRTDIKELLGSGLSLMPDGLEAAINHQEMADLIAFLQAALPTTGTAAVADRERDFGTLPGLIEPTDKQ
ncbi:MAG: CehA/McbA family metallohydrolase [Verrucomicrobia bacterium]|nr:CehA/McbA family metallohydrolase [Verrucomicrobiota bacterium]